MGGKVCPATVPVAKGLGSLSWVVNRDRRRALQSSAVAAAGSTEEEDTGVSTVGVGTESQQQKMSVPCNTDIHPTGQPGDEVCPYSDCDDEDGEHSAICACIDLARYGIGDGMEWVCMHATCDCEDKSKSADTATVPNDAAMEEEEEKHSTEEDSVDDLTEAASASYSYRGWCESGILIFVSYFASWIFHM